MALRKTLLAILMLLLLPAAQAQAQMSSGLIVIRDTEIEDTLRAWCIPIWRAAGLNPDAVKLILIQSSDINAFVAGGSNVFLFTGLIQAAKNPGEVLAVVAHETGHIAGGHLIRGREEMEHASYEAMLATLLGVGAGAAGAGDAAQALIMGGQGLALSNYLSHSRVQESSADQAGLRFMETAGYNPSGLATFLETMKNQELLPQSQQNAYVRTHPLTADRLDAMRAGIAKSAFASKPYPAEWNKSFDLIKAKLAGFIEPQRVNWVYSESDSSTPALYARAIAAYRRSEKDKALALIDRLIASDSGNPYYHEMKGQMLRDFADLDRAAGEYRKAVALKPDAALVRIDLAQVLIELAGRGGQDSAALYAEAEKNLSQAQLKEPKSSEVHRLYATMYGRQGRDAEARYHLAEEAALKGDIEEAKTLLAGAMPGLAPGSKAYRQAADLKVFLDAQPEKDEKRR